MLHSVTLLLHKLFWNRAAVSQQVLVWLKTWHACHFPKNIWLIENTSFY